MKGVYSSGRMVSAGKGPLLQSQAVTTKLTGPCKPSSHDVG